MNRVKNSLFTPTSMYGKIYGIPFSRYLAEHFQDKKINVAISVHYAIQRTTRNTT